MAAGLNHGLNPHSHDRMSPDRTITPDSQTGVGHAVPSGSQGIPCTRPAAGSPVPHTPHRRHHGTARAGRAIQHIDSASHELSTWCRSRLHGVNRQCCSASQTPQERDLAQQKCKNHCSCHPVRHEVQGAWPCAGPRCCYVLYGARSGWRSCRKALGDRTPLPSLTPEGTRADTHTLAHTACV